MNDLKEIPSIDSLLKEKKALELIDQYGRELTLKATRIYLNQIRESIKKGGNVPENKKILDSVEAVLKDWVKPSLIPVINATGIIIHTNLGRAPLSKETMEAMSSVSTGYSNLEYDLVPGKRGKRSNHAESILQKLTGAESALVVNNNAAAMLLVLTSLAKGKKVVIAHSQLVEIGGGFRVPDVMRQSGAKLNAIGTTNRVHISDYEKALEENSSLVLVAHHSNFKIIGFTTEPPLSEITESAHKMDIPLVYDLGSGSLMDTEKFGLPHEPTVQEAVADGADIICFSGDKLLGGPQAGIIIGKKEYLEKIKKHPLARAVRADKLCLSGLSQTLIHYLKGEALEKIPVWVMISRNISGIKKSAENWKKEIGTGAVIRSRSMVGGGSLPEESLDTWVLAISVDQPNQFLEKLRQCSIPVIARIEEDKVLLDPRTVLPEQEMDLVKFLMKSL